MKHNKGIRLRLLLLVVLILPAVTCCDKVNNQAECTEVPANLTCGPNICAVYHPYSATVYLYWDAVENVEGYNLYTKGSNDSYVLKGSAESPKITVYQSKGASIELVSRVRASVPGFIL
jgi:hypothetical protein